MKEEDILEVLSLPRSVGVRRTFPFNKMSDKMTLKQRKYLSGAITTRGIRILASINPNNTNIPAYENEIERYEEIHIFLIRVENLDTAKEVFKILSSIIPYPLIIIFNCGSDYQIALGRHKKQINNSQLKVMDVHISSTINNLKEYLSKLDFRHLEKVNLKYWYESFIKRVIDIELERQYQKFHNPFNDFNLLKQLNDLDKEIDKLVYKAQKETQMNRRIEYQLKANEVKEKKNRLLEGENIDD